MGLVGLAKFIQVLTECLVLLLQENVFLQGHAVGMVRVVRAHGGSRGLQKGSVHGVDVHVWHDGVAVAG